MAPSSHASVLVARSGGIHPPISVIASWPHPNYVNPEERGLATPIALAVVMGITFLVFVARIWARVIVSKSAGIDGSPANCTRIDLLMSIAMVPLFGLTITTILAITQYGFQWHIWDQNSTTAVTSRESSMAIEILYLTCTTPIKISILCFYRRITGSLTNKFVYSTWGSIILCALYGILFTLLIIFTCSPVVGYFHVFDIPWRFTNELHCFNEGAIIVACAAISTVQDLVICMLPIFLIWNLRITRQQRFALCGIFGMGIITCICGILRTYYATYVYYFTYDMAWYSYYGWVWTVLEAQLAVICASIPALKVFLQRYFRVIGSRAGYSDSSNRRTPIKHSTRSRGLALISGDSSTVRSRIEAGRPHDGDVPLSGIKVSQGVKVHVEDRDDSSQKSFASTQNLTIAQIKEQGWGSRHPEKDIEMGRVS